jgi:serine/threonine-protein kinase RsbW
MIIPSDLQAAQQVEKRLLREVLRQEYSDAATFAIKLALEEGLINAIKHGNRMDPAKTVDVAFDVTPEETVITITDQGEGFSPHHLPDPTADENLEKPSGRGVMLMRAYMDDVRFNEKGNQVRLVKKNV